MHGGWVRDETEGRDSQSPFILSSLKLHKVISSGIVVQINPATARNSALRGESQGQRQLNCPRKPRPCESQSVPQPIQGSICRLPSRCLCFFLLVPCHCALSQLHNLKVVLWQHLCNPWPAQQSVTEKTPRNRRVSGTLKSP